MNITLHQGNALGVLKQLPNQSVHTCITSPPYYNLRDYNHDQQIGLEDTPDHFIAALTNAFREVHRVLRDDGTLWLNMGDSYATATSGDRNVAGDGRETPGKARKRNQVDNLKPKNLIGMPWRLALALQADGWIIRSDIIWAKGVSFCPTYSGSVMPSSIKDRPTPSHEHLFLLSKQPKYFYDYFNAREPGNDNPHASGRLETLQYGDDDPGNRKRTLGILRDSPWGSHGLRNLRSVWTVNPQPFPNAHFATYPIKLITPCIKAATPDHGVCSKCLTPYQRIVEHPTMPSSLSECSDETKMSYHPQQFKGSGTAIQKWRNENPPKTTGWKPSCICTDNKPIPATILDPFSGSGTTSIAAALLGRNSIAVELNPDYITLSIKRITEESPLFVDIQTVIHDTE